MISIDQLDFKWHQQCKGRYGDIRALTIGTSGDSIEEIEKNFLILIDFGRGKLISFL